MTKMDIAKAKGLGRHGDDHLLHVSGQELASLNAMAPGGLTTNPHTGLPEAFKLSSLLGIALPLAASFLLPGVGTALGGALTGALGLGSTGALASGVGAGLLGAGGTLLGGGSLKDAALTGVAGGIGGGLMSGLGGGASAAAQGGQALTNIAAPGAMEVATNVPGLVTPAALSSAAQGLTQGGMSTAMKLGLGGMGLAALSPHQGPAPPQEENKNPNAGHERMDRQLLDPYTQPGGYIPGSSQGEAMFYNPQDTTGQNWFYNNGAKRLGYAQGGPVQGGTPMTSGTDPMPQGQFFNPALFQNSFQPRNITPPTQMMHAYGDMGPGTMHWTAPPKPIAPPVAQPAPQPTAAVAAPAPPPTAVSPSPYAPDLQSILDSLKAGGYGPGMQFGPQSMYAQGGPVQGPGDGSSDSVPAQINAPGGKTAASLSNGEYVVSSDVVSHLGNGSNQAGAARLNNMTKTVRKIKTGHTGMPPRI